MSNDLQYLNSQSWANDMQTEFMKVNVSVGCASTRLEEKLKKGTRCNRPYMTTPVAVDYTKGSAITNKDVDSTNEYLDIDTTKVVPFYIDDVDEIQNDYDAAVELARRSARVLSNVIDQKVASTAYAGATDDLYNDDVGGSGSTTAISLTTSNIQQYFTAGVRKLTASLGYNPNDKVALCSSRTVEQLRLYQSGTGSNLADTVGLNGNIGFRFGFRIVENTNAPFTATWTPADNPTEADTVTISGVVFTFNATPSGAGSVDIGGSTAVSIDNLVAAINDSGTAGTTYIQLTKANRFKLNSLQGIVATDGTTCMTIVGYGDIIVASLQTDEWSAQVSHDIFMVNKAVDLAVQTKANTKIVPVYNMLGDNFFIWTNLGTKVFADGAKQIIDGNVNASAWA